jgi:hypothetical protein
MGSQLLDKPEPTFFRLGCSSVVNSLMGPFQGWQQSTACARHAVPYFMCMRPACLAAVMPHNISACCCAPIVCTAQRDEAPKYLSQMYGVWDWIPHPSPTWGALLPWLMGRCPTLSHMSRSTTVPSNLHYSRTHSSPQFQGAMPSCVCRPWGKGMASRCRRQAGLVICAMVSGAAGGSFVADGGWFLAQAANDSSTRGLEQ